MHSRVADIIADKGQSITYEQISGVANNATGARALSVVASFNIKASIRKYSPQELTNLIKIGDRKAKIAADGLGFTPKKKDRVTIGTEIFEVFLIDEIKLEDTTILYEITLRGGVNG